MNTGCHPQIREQIEAYGAAIRRDMNYLEGEKTGVGVLHGRSKRKRCIILGFFSYVLFGVFIVLMALILVLRGSEKAMDTRS